MSGAGMIGVLVFLTFGGAIAAFFSRMARGTQRAVGLGHRMLVRTRAGQVHEIANALVTMNTSVVRKAIERLTSGPLPPPKTDLGPLRDREQRFIEAQADKSKALYAVNTFRAFASGWMDYLLSDGNAQGSDATVGVEEFEEFVTDYCQNQVQKEIPHHAAQFDAFYRASSPRDGEFLIGWSERIILTSQRLVLLTEGGDPQILADVPLSEVQEYSASNG
jgi:hypothetical protein